ncbi:MAG: nickel-responsive transcriptional regulator NikR [Candidatus Hydrothermarchaeales archaeon]
MAREKVERFGVSLSPKLLVKFDEVMKERGYTNRSEAIRDLMRDCIVSSEWEKGGDVVGALTLVYDHHVRGVMDKLTALQHEHHANVVSSMHVHLDEHNCMEFLVLRGQAEEVKRIADSLISARGVKHGKLVASTIGKDVP